MADNPTIDNGDLTDVVVAADEITSPYTGGSAQAQAVKLLSGAANSNEVIEGTAANGLEVDVTRVSGTVTVDSELTTADLDTGAGTDTRAVVGLVGSKSGGGALIPGDATAGLKVDLGADNDVTVTGTVTANPTRPSTPTQSSVNDTASSTTLLASNANRLGATIYNDSTVNLFVKLGATASATSFTVRLEPNGYYEVPFGYTGVIDGIWASDASGAARITELAA